MPIDILFITHLHSPRETNEASVHRSLRLEIDGAAATIPVLRRLSRAATTAIEHADSTAVPAAPQYPPVLTPFYLQDYMTRRGLVLHEVPCLETGMEEVERALAQGVTLIALSTTWLADPRGAECVREAAARLKALAPDVPLVIGGVGVRKWLRIAELFRRQPPPDVPKEALARLYMFIDAQLDQVFDAAVVSEGGEATLAAIATRVRDGRDFRDLPNLAIPAPDGYHFTPTEPEQTDLDQEIVDWRHHAARIRAFEAPIRTGVGCPFQCAFCDFAGLYRPRQRSLESLLTELRSLADALPSPRRVFFADDNIALTRRKLLEFCRALIGEHVDLSWRAFCRADAIDAEVAELMRAAGCRECLLGIESGDPTILRNMNKRLDLDRSVRAVELLDAQGISTQGTFLVGFPGECSESIERTAQFLSSLPSGPKAGALHRYYLFRFMVLPLCPAANPEYRGRFHLEGIGEEWSHVSMNSREAAEAMRQLFVKVRGPSHMYLELVPPEWPVAATRHVMELRDTLQKAHLLGDGRGQIDALLQAVLTAEGLGGTAAS